MFSVCVLDEELAQSSSIHHFSEGLQEIRVTKELFSFTKNGRFFQCTPHMTNFAAGIQVRTVAMTEEVLFLISNEAKVFVKGKDPAKTGVLGIPNVFEVSEFTQVPIFKEVQAQDVAVSDTHAALVDILGQVYTWGTGAYGQLGFSIGAMQSPEIVPIPSHVAAFKVTCGPLCTVLCTQGGFVYLFGRIGAETQRVSEQLDLFTVPGLEKYFIVKVVAGREHLVCLNEEGVPLLIDEKLYVHQLPTSRVDKMLDICMTRKHVWGLSNTGSIYKWYIDYEEWTGTQWEGVLFETNKKIYGVAGGSNCVAVISEYTEQVIATEKGKVSTFKNSESTVLGKRRNACNDFKHDLRRLYSRGNEDTISSIIQHRADHALRSKLQRSFKALSQLTIGYGFQELQHHASIQKAQKIAYTVTSLTHILEKIRSKCSLRLLFAMFSQLRSHNTHKVSDFCKSLSSGGSKRGFADIVKTEALKSYRSTLIERVKRKILSPEAYKTALSPTSPTSKPPWKPNGAPQSKLKFSSAERRNCYDSNLKKRAKAAKSPPQS